MTESQTVVFFFLNGIGAIALSHMPNYAGLNLPARLRYQLAVFGLALTVGSMLSTIAC